MAYQHHIIKMQKGLGGGGLNGSNMTGEFQLWAGAKKASNSGELNLSLNEKCTAGGLTSKYQVKTWGLPLLSPKGKERKTPKTQKS